MYGYEHAKDLRIMIAQRGSAVILSPFGISPGQEGFLRGRHVADVTFWARLRTQKRGDKGMDAGHAGDIASRCVVDTT
jgi:hypothetical protein